MNKRLKTILGIYALGGTLSIVCSFLYLYFRTSLIFVAIFVFTFIISYLMPLWFKLFLNTKPYYGKYRGRLLDFTKLHGLNLKDIYIRKSNRSNACSFSLWNNKAVTLNSGSFTLEKHPYEEIEGVMAHELGHHANFGIYIYTTIVAALLILLSSINIEIYSYLKENLINFIYICLATSALILPLVLMISRFMESRADQYAISILKDPLALGRFLERMLLFEKQAGDSWPTKNPPFLLKAFLVHPWVYDRIRATKSI